MPSTPAARLEPWGARDLQLLEKLLGDPAMTEHLGGPERPEKIADRQARYAIPDSGQSKIVLEPTGEPVGWVGYWDREWRNEIVHELGWAVLPTHQGRGIASLATAELVAVLHSMGCHRYAHAFPSVANAPSNAVCRRVGFACLGACEFEYPPGNFMRCNDWRFDLLG